MVTLWLRFSCLKQENGIADVVAMIWVSIHGFSLGVKGINGGCGALIIADAVSFCHATQLASNAEAGASKTVRYQAGAWQRDGYGPYVSSQGLRA